MVDYKTEVAFDVNFVLKDLFENKYFLVKLSCLMRGEFAWKPT